MASGTITNFANNSGTGYCKMPDGTLIQWGTVVISEGAYVESVTFPMAFVDTKYSLTFGVYYDNISPSISDKYIWGARVGRTPNTASNSIDWLASGRWK